MKRQYSVIALASVEVELPEQRIYLERGRNVFTTFTQDLPGLLEQLERRGVSVLQVSTPEQPPTKLTDLLLEGETTAVLYGQDHARRPGS
jgi:hypothetical protein